jgi:hypothetical protein
MSKLCATLGDVLSRKLSAFRIPFCNCSIHVGHIEFDNKLLVLMQWAWNYLTRKRGARLITGEDLLPVVHGHQEPTDSTSAQAGGAAPQA